MDFSTQFVYIIFYILIFFVLILISIIVFVIKSRKIILKKKLEKKDIEIKFQKEILIASILSQEEERKRISRDLHDDISSKLIAVSLNLHLLKSEKTKESSKADIIENTSIINNKAIESSRKIAHHLYPPVLEKFGLVQALKELVLDFNKTKVVSIRFNSEIKFENETSNFHLQIFRIIQELINNSIKHGQATIIEMKFRQHNSVNQFFYIDNGVGFDSSKIEKYRGLGFSNIENRIQNINGTYNMFSEVNEGFQFEFSF